MVVWIVGLLLAGLLYVLIPIVEQGRGRPPGASTGDCYVDYSTFVATDGVGGEGGCSDGGAGSCGGGD